MNKINPSSTKEIIRHNKCQMRFLDKLVLKKVIDKKMIINVITCSMLESPSSSGVNEMNTCNHGAFDQLVCDSYSAATRYQGRDLGNHNS